MARIRISGQREGYALIHACMYFRRTYGFDLRDAKALADSIAARRVTMIDVPGTDVVSVAAHMDTIGYLCTIAIRNDSSCEVCITGFREWWSWKKTARLLRQLGYDNTTTKAVIRRIDAGKVVEIEGKGDVAAAVNGLRELGLLVDTVV